RWISGPSGFEWTSTLRPPRNANPPTITRAPAGTSTFAPPRIAMIVSLAPSPGGGPRVHLGAAEDAHEGLLRPPVRQAAPAAAAEDRYVGAHGDTLSAHSRDGSRPRALLA